MAKNTVNRINSWSPQQPCYTCHHLWLVFDFRLWGSGLGRLHVRSFAKSLQRHGARASGLAGELSKETGVFNRQSFGASASFIVRGRPMNQETRCFITKIDWFSLWPKATQPGNIVCGPTKTLLHCCSTIRAWARLGASETKGCGWTAIGYLFRMKSTNSQPDLGSSFGLL